MIKISTVVFGLTLTVSLVGASIFGQAIADAPQTDFMAKPAPLPTPTKTEVITVPAPLYEIAEPNLLELFLAAVAEMKTSGEYQKRFDAQKEKISDRMQNPPANDSLQTAQAIRRQALQPAVPESLPEQLLQQARQTALPRLSRVLLFIDARDQKNLEAMPRIAASLPKDARIVLTGGSIPDVSRLTGKRIFFDQGGALARQFGFTAQPAAVFNGENGPEFIEFPISDFVAVLPLLKGSTSS